jgi:heme/copper-type cytochrome/quinol oxidase subunit 4
MNYLSLIIMLLVAAILVIAGTAIVKQPQLLSNYHSFTEEEKASPAFHRYLKSVRNIMIAIAIALVGGEWLSKWFDSNFYSILSILGVCILLLYLLYVQGKISSRMKRKSRIYGIFVFVLIAGLIILPLCRGTSVSYTNETLRISGMYGTEIPSSEIRRVSLEQTLPEITWRTNGLSVGDVKKGYFRTGDDRKVKLFLASDKAPFLHVQTIWNEDIYINSSRPEEIRKLYLQMEGKYSIR